MYAGNCPLRETARTTALSGLLVSYQGCLVTHLAGCGPRLLGARFLHYEPPPQWLVPVKPEAGNLWLLPRWRRRGADGKAL